MEKGKRISRLCLALAVALTVAGLAFVLRPGLVWGDGPMAFDYQYLSWSGALLPYDINPDSQGNLWMATMATVGRYDPSTGRLTDWYETVGSCAPLDPHMDAAGDVWFACMGSEVLGRLNPGSDQFTTWSEIAGSGGHSGLSFDDAGRIGVVGSGDPRIHVFDPSTYKSEIYFPPGSFSAERLAWDSARNSFWIADYGNVALLQLNRGNNEFTWWYAPDPLSMWNDVALDQGGLVWLTDQNQGRVSSFDPGSQTLTEYTVPGTGMAPYRVFPVGPIWFNEQGNRYLGVFEPGLVPGAGGIVTTTVLTPTNVFTSTIITNLLGVNWPSVYRTETIPAANPFTVTEQITRGFALYQPSRPGFYPNDIAYSQGKIWYTDFSIPGFGQLFGTGVSALSIGKSAPITVGLGQVFTYTIVVSETKSQLPVIGAVVTDRIPVSTTFAWASDGGVQVGQVVSWANLTITQGQSLTLNFAVRVNRVPSGTLITNDAYRVITSTAGISTGLGLSVTSRAVFVSAEAYLPTIMRNNVITP